MPAVGRKLTGVLLLGVVLFLAGCGGGGRPTGKVTWKGTPVARAELLFAPASDPQNVVFGVSGPEGTYILDYGRRSGLPSGPCKVTITHYTLKNGKPLPEGEAGAALRGDLDKVLRHAFEFDREIPSGSSTQDFELNDGKKAKQ
jgi:hypothetical protein